MKEIIKEVREEMDRADERELRKELIHTAAMALRFLKNFDISILAQKHRQ